MIPIIKSNCDKREYQLIDLPNKMRCLLISDPEADKSAASINVHVGSALDPRPLYGVAHFLEHMLFQGTEKYPKENEYSEFIKNNGGYDNAYTSLEDTNYHFECSNEVFEEALDRLSQFFICPSFSENSADREIKAVDSEYNMSLNNDAWHFFNLNQQLSAVGSNYNRFVCGNVKSLSVPGIRDSLLEFHKKWYSSNIMTLCVCGKVDLQQLEQWVHQKFSAVVNKEVIVPSLCDEPIAFPPANLSKLVKLVPVKDRDIINFQYVVPYCERDHQTQPLDYLSSVIGHEGENSLLSYLKSEDLALDLCTSIDHSLSGISFFEIQITLTKNGLQNYESVIESTYQYLQMLRTRGPQQFFFQEEYDIGLMKFQFADKKNSMSSVVSFAKSMPLFNSDEISQIIRSQYIVDIFDQDAIKSYLNLLCSTDTLNIFIRSKSYEGLTDQVVDWYQTKYSIQDFSEGLLNKMNNPNCQLKDKKLDFPLPNNLIAKNFSIIPKDEEKSLCPKLIKRWSKCTDLWYKKDDKFDRPKAMVNLRIYTNDCQWNHQSKANVFCRLWTSIQEEFLREFNYNASAAKLEFEVKVGNDNIELLWSGFNDSMPNYIKEILSRIKSMDTHDLSQAFEQVKEKLLQDWKNFYLEQTYKQANPILQSMLVNLQFEKSELRSELEGFTYLDFKTYLNDWMKSGRCVWYVCGNYGYQESIDLVEQSRSILALNPILIENCPQLQIVALPTSTSLYFDIPLEDKTNENSCSLTVYEVGSLQDNLHENLINQVVMQYLDEPYFDDLRTKQQLGYVVYCRSLDNQVVQNIFLVQSPKQSSEYLINATNDFLLSIRQKVATITEEEFLIQRKAVQTKLAEKDINLYEENYRFWSEIVTHNYDFEIQNNNLKELEKVTKEEFQSHVEKIFFSNQSRRLDLQLTSDLFKEEQSIYREKNSNHEIFKDIKRVKVEGTIADFKKQSNFYPDIFKTKFANIDQQRQIEELQK